MDCCSGARIGEVIGGKDANEKAAALAQTFISSAMRFSCPARKRLRAAHNSQTKNCKIFCATIRYFQFYFAGYIAKLDV